MEPRVCRGTGRGGGKPPCDIPPHALHTLRLRDYAHPGAAPPTCAPGRKLGLCEERLVPTLCRRYSLGALAFGAGTRIGSAVQDISPGTIPCSWLSGGRPLGFGLGSCTVRRIPRPSIHHSILPAAGFPRIGPFRPLVSLEPFRFPSCTLFPSQPVSALRFKLKDTSVGQCSATCLYHTRRHADLGLCCVVPILGTPFLHLAGSL